VGCRFVNSTVLLVSTSYPSSPSDWRGVFIRHLVKALSLRQDLRLKVWCPPGAVPPSVELVASQQDATWLSALMRSGGIAHQMRKGGLRGKLRVIDLLRRLRRGYRGSPNVDVRHVNWLQNALPLQRDSVPLLVTVLGTDMRLLKLPGMATLLRRVFRQRKTVIAPNAEWMVPELTRRFGMVADVQYVPFGIDGAWYGLERSRVVGGSWLCVSRLTRAKLGKLLEWWAPLATQVDGPRLTLIGPMQEQIDLPAWVEYVGPASSDQLMKGWFPNATGLVTLSEHSEGRPQVMLEAMAAGLPIIASAIPAHVDLLRHLDTGWLCHDAQGLSDGLAALSEPETNRMMGESARRWVREHVGTWNDCAGRYAHLYRRLLEESA